MRLRYVSATRQLRFYLATIGILANLPTYGQQASSALTGSVEEEYSSHVKTTSPRSLIGAVLGTPPPKLNLNYLSALVPNTQSGSKVCFSATTSNGVYSALGLLSVPPGASGTLAVRPKGFSQFAKELASYPGNVFTGKLTTGGDCFGTASSAVILPLFFSGSKGELKVAINSHGSLSVKSRLESRAKLDKIIYGDCTALSERSVAFDYICQFHFDPARLAGPNVELILDKVPRSGPKRRETYLIHLGA